MADVGPSWRGAQPELLVGAGALAGALSTTAAPLVIRDAALTDTPLGTAMAAALPGGTPLVELPARCDPAGIDAVRRLLAAHPDAPVVAVGGGAILDTVKLATLVPADAPLGADDPSSWTAALTGASGLATPPPHWSRRTPLVTVPTTVGTSSEVSPSAVLEARPGWRWLVQGPALVPSRAVLDPVAFVSLPAHLLTEGAAEVTLRLLGPYTFGPSTLPGADEAALAQLAEGGRVLRASARGAGDGAHDLALRVCLLGGQSHSSLALAGRSRYAHPLWFVANELAALAGWRKVPATLALLPGWVDLVRRGRPGWGDAQRLRTAADAFGCRGLSDPERLCDLIAGLGLPPRAATDVTAQAVAARVAARWAGRFPMLAAVDGDDPVALLTTALAA